MRSGLAALAAAVVATTLVAAQGPNGQEAGIARSPAPRVEPCPYLKALRVTPVPVFQLNAEQRQLMRPGDGNPASATLGIPPMAGERRIPSNFYEAEAQ